MSKVVARHTPQWLSEGKMKGSEDLQAAQMN